MNFHKILLGISAITDKKNIPIKNKKIMKKHSIPVYLLYK